MAENHWNPWKATAIGLALVMSTALVTGLVVANWSGTEADKKAATATPPTATATATTRVAGAPAAKTTTAAAPAAPVVHGTPPQAVVDACNRQAAADVGSKNKTVEVVKDAGIGAVLGAAVGAAGGAIAGGGKGAGKGAAIGGLVGAGGGTLYGLNENHKQDERYRSAYGACMRSRGYAG